MKLLLICLAFLYSNIIHATSQANTCNQSIIIYKFGVHQINKEKYIYNLRLNVQTYVDYKMNIGWTYNHVIEFRNAFNKYITAFSDPNDPYRFYTNDFGSLIDSKGEFGNVDSDDYWYDNKGNTITGYEYHKLSERKKKKYYCFYANREVASYFLEIGNAMVKKTSENKETKSVQHNNNSINVDSDYVGW